MSELFDGTPLGHDDKRVKPSSPLIVISNRLPFVLKRDEDGNLSRSASAGGLVTAVAPVVIDCEGLWVGWTGLDSFNENIEKIPESDPNDQAPTAGLKSSQTIPVSIDPKLFDSFYNGCCNGTFWPLFHSMPDRAIFENKDWEAYTKVNELFAFATLNAIRKLHTKHVEEGKPNDAPPIIWIHDYQLMLAANTIRTVCDEEGMTIRMGFFLHIPFPSFDIIRIFPWVDEIVMGMLGCDLVGFHIEDYCVNFLDCCQRILGCRIDRKKMVVEHHRRGVKVKALPIGIPYDRFELLAKTSPAAFANDGVKVILGIDRLDYTKGLVQRLKALEYMFTAYPIWRGKVAFLQVAVPSRTDVKEYQELKEEIDKLVGHINGKFSTPKWSPIRYIFGSVNQNDLAAFYRDADLALVTPLRDGMNLVAKEYVACQDDKNPGVLVLSPFAGAGGLMHEALMANPYETSNIAQALDRALRMPLEERQLRMNQLKKRERRMDVNAWVKEFLSEMDSIHGLTANVSCDHDPLSPLGADLGSITTDIFENNIGPFLDSYSKLGIIVDFDGTLSPLAATPALAFIPHETKKVLERMANMMDVNIVIISGRDVDDLRQKVGIEGLTYAGCQGLKIIHPDGQRYIHHVEPEYVERLAKLETELKDTVERDGAWVERKDLLVAWHFRNADKDMKTALMSKAKEVYTRHGFEVLTVSKRFENVPAGRDRGDACIYILRSLFGLDWEERVTVIYAGDSAADELAINRLKGVAHTFRIINEDSTIMMKTLADYRLEGTDGVLALFKYLERKLLGRSPRNLSRTSSILSLGCALDKDVFEVMEGGCSPDAEGSHMRRRTLSHGSKPMMQGFRSRTSSQGSNCSLRRKTLNRLHNKLSVDESGHSCSPAEETK